MCPLFGSSTVCVVHIINTARRLESEFEWERVIKADLVILTSIMSVQFVHDYREALLKWSGEQLD